jgi:hypothetical protein
LRLLILLLLLPLSAAADPWVFDFEFAFGIPDRYDRLLNPACTKVVPVQYVDFYVRDPKAGWEIACGNNQPMFLSFLGRRCWKPLPNFEMECGWRHFSSPNDRNEISFDAFSVRGRFEWGKK